MKEGRVTLAIATNFDWSLEMFTTYTVCPRNSESRSYTCHLLQMKTNYKIRVC